MFSHFSNLRSSDLGLRFYFTFITHAQIMILVFFLLLELVCGLQTYVSQRHNNGYADKQHYEAKNAEEVRK